MVGVGPKMGLSPLLAAGAQRRVATWTLLLLFAIVLSVGCENKPLPPPAAAEIQMLDRPGLESIIKSHAGNVVMVDFWATWCPPCVALFPHSVELQRRYGPRGLSVVTVSLDDPGDWKKVAAFLQSHRGGTENFLAREGGTTRTFEDFQIGEGIPFLQFYDRRGKLRETITGAYEEKIDHAVQQLLDEK
jgi:thiol-disulfide isomerase/thioredoxin